MGFGYEQHCTACTNEHMLTHRSENNGLDPSVNLVKYVNTHICIHNRVVVCSNHQAAVHRGHLLHHIIIIIIIIHNRGASTWGTDNATPKDPQGSWPGSSGPSSGPSSQQAPVPRAGSGQSAAWGGAGLPEVRQATALLSKDEFPTLGTAADAEGKRRESSRLSNRGSDMEGGRGHWDSDDRAVDHGRG